MKYEQLVSKLTYVCLSGYCAYFDPADDKIKGMYHLDCSMFQSPCPTRYNSIEAYKCMFLLLLNEKLVWGRLVPFTTLYLHIAIL